MIKITAKQMGGRRLRKILNDMKRNAGKERTTQIGVFSESRYEDETFVANIASIQEYGTVDGKIPSRPFMRTTVPKIKDNMVGAVKNNLNPKTLEITDNMMKQIGEHGVTATKETIDEMREPPLAPSTVARKGHDKLLIDSKKLYDSVDYKVD